MRGLVQLGLRVYQHLSRWVVRVLMLVHPDRKSGTSEISEVMRVFGVV